MKSPRSLRAAARIKTGASPEKGPGAPFDLAKLRMREIEKIIRERHGKVIPPHIDPAPYLYAIGCAAIAVKTKPVPSKVVYDWCCRFVPHVVRDFDALFEPIGQSLRGRLHNLSSRAVAQLLCVKFDERQRLHVKTIGASDLSNEELRERVYEKRRETERLRLAEKRSRNQTRAEYLAANRISRERPWEALQISRTTWYRRKAASDETRSLQLTQDDETSALQRAECNGTSALRGAHRRDETGSLPIGETQGSAEAPVPRLSADQVPVEADPSDIDCKNNPPAIDSHQRLSETTSEYWRHVHENVGDEDDDQ